MDLGSVTSDQLCIQNLEHHIMNGKFVNISHLIYKHNTLVVCAVYVVRLKK